MPLTRIVLALLLLPAAAAAQEERVALRGTFLDVAFGAELVPGAAVARAVHGEAAKTFNDALDLLGLEPAELFFAGAAPPEWLPGVRVRSERLLVVLRASVPAARRGVEGFVAELRKGRARLEVAAPAGPRLTDAERLALRRAVARAVVGLALGDRAPLWFAEGLAERIADPPEDDAPPPEPERDLAFESALAAESPAAFARLGGPAKGRALVRWLVAERPKLFRRLLEDLRFLLTHVRHSPEKGAVRREMNDLLLARLADPGEVPEPFHVRMSARVSTKKHRGEAPGRSLRWRTLQECRLAWRLPGPSTMKLWVGVRGATGVSYERHPTLRNRGEMVTWDGWEWEAVAEDAAKMEDAGISYAGDCDRFAFLLLEVWSANGVGYVFFTEWEL